MPKRKIEIEILECSSLMDVLCFFSKNKLVYAFSEVPAVFSKASKLIKNYFGSNEKEVPQQNIPEKDVDIHKLKDGFLLEIKGQKIPIKIIEKKGAETMKLEIDIDEINLGNLLDELIKSQKGQENSSKKMAALFSMLETLNHEIDDENKLRLFSVIFGWMNEENILNKALQEYLKEYKKLGGEDGKIKTLEKLDLKVGKITLTTDSESSNER